MNYSQHQLTRRAAFSSMEAIAGALLDAQVDWNPHQIDAAMFATSNPLSTGVIPANVTEWSVFPSFPRSSVGMQIALLSVQPRHRGKVVVYSSHR